MCETSKMYRKKWKDESWKEKRGDKKCATGPLVCTFALGFLATKVGVAQLKQKFLCEGRNNNFQSTLGNEPGSFVSLPRQALYLYATTTANSQWNLIKLWFKVKMSLGYLNVSYTQPFLNRWKTITSFRLCYQNDGYCVKTDCVVPIGRLWIEILSHGSL